VILIKRKRVAFLAGNIDKSGGTERATSVIAEALALRSYEVFIITMQGTAKPFFPVPDDVEIIGPLTEAERVLPILPSISLKLRTLVQRLHIDSLVVVDTISVLFSIPALAGTGVQHVAWEHFNFKNNNGKIVRSFARRLAKYFCDDIVVLTHKDKSFWLKSGALRSRIHVLPNPAPGVAASPSSGSEKKIVLALGRPAHTKGFDLLIKAWLLLVEAFPDWRLLIVGLDDGERSLLRETLLGLNHKSSISLLPRTEDVSSLYAKSEIYCLASRHEGFPIVLLEAMAHGLAILSVDCETGPADILADYPIKLVQPGNVAALATGLEIVMSDSSLRNHAKVIGQNLTLAYQVEKIVPKWEMIFSL